MTEAERAAALADDLSLWCKQDTSAVDSDLIISALRAYSVPASTDVGMREAVAKAEYEAKGLHLSTGRPWGMATDGDKHYAFIAADAALSAIHASGWRIVPADYTDRIVSEARRYASHYPIGSDGRNTFEMFVDFVVRLAAAPTPSDARSDTAPLRETF